MWCRDREPIDESKITFKYRVVFAIKYFGIALLLLGLIAHGAIVLIGLAILAIGAVAQRYLSLFRSNSGRKRDRG